MAKRCAQAWNASLPNIQSMRSADSTSSTRCVSAERPSGFANKSARFFVQSALACGWPSNGELSGCPVVNDDQREEEEQRKREECEVVEKRRTLMEKM